jgi:hypothetical protein
MGLLGVPHEFALDNRSIVNGETAFLIYLARMASHTKFATLAEEFGAEASRIGRIIKAVEKWLWAEWGFKVEAQPGRPDYLKESVGRWPHYCECIRNCRKDGGDGEFVGHPEDALFLFLAGFLDGSRRAVCKPGGPYREYDPIIYGGKPSSKYHALQYQIVSFPDGMIGDVYGPIAGRYNDLTLLRESNLQTRMTACQLNNAVQFSLLGDKIYPNDRGVCRLWKRLPGRGLTAQQKQDNSLLTTKRVAVEWAFSDTSREWPAVSHRPNQRVFLSAIGRQYKCAILLTNILNCLYGSNTSKKFDCKPPSVEEYLVR